LLLKQIKHHPICKDGIHLLTEMCWASARKLLGKFISLYIISKASTPNPFPIENSKT
jgi:hypothetical protein